MDRHGGLPKWWQWFFPRYGNWGAPGWSAGAWIDDPAATGWDVPAIDAMDAFFKEHDRAYQEGRSRLEADIALVAGLHATGADGMYARLYRAGAIVVFSIHAGWQMLVGTNGANPARERR